MLSSCFSWRVFSPLLILITRLVAPKLLAISLAMMSTLSLAHQDTAITPIAWPNSITPQMLLGKQLFFDTRFSKDNQLSCATCHQFDKGGSIPVDLPTMFNGDKTRYNSTSIFNLNPDYFLGWVGNLNSAQDQLNQLMGGKKVMGLSWEELVTKLQANDQYVATFKKVFNASISIDTITRAIVSYEQALVTPSAFDRYLQGDELAVSSSVLAGYELFQRYGCIACHQGKNVGGNLLQKIGILTPYKPGLEGESVAGLGRYNFTNVQQDMQVFRVPGLRNVAQSGPYLHDGSIAELKAVIKLMGKHQLGRDIPDEDVNLIEAFLQSLTGKVHPELSP
jgi:cytochrome c peroxidase